MDPDELARLAAILYAAASGAALHLHQHGDAVSRRLSFGLMEALDALLRLMEEQPPAC